MASFLVSASVFGRTWQLFVRFLVLLANILAWCVRWDVLSAVRWALPERRSEVSEGSDPEQPAGTKCQVDSRDASTPQHSWFDPRPSARGDCGTKSKDSEWPYQSHFNTDNAKCRIEALGWTVSRKDDMWRAVRGLRAVGSSDIGTLADLVAKENNDGPGIAASEFDDCSHSDTRDGKRVVGKSRDIRGKIEANRTHLVGVLPSELLRAGWSRNCTAETASGRSVRSDDPDAAAWNMSGAVNQALGAFSDQWQQYIKELAGLLRERHPGSSLKGDGLVYRWNRMASGQEEAVAAAEEVERRLGMGHEQV